MTAEPCIAAGDGWRCDRPPERQRKLCSGHRAQAKRGLPLAPLRAWRPWTVERVREEQHERALAMNARRDAEEAALVAAFAAEAERLERIRRRALAKGRIPESRSKLPDDPQESSKPNRQDAERYGRSGRVESLDPDILGRMSTDTGSESIHMRGMGRDPMPSVTMAADGSDVHDNEAMIGFPPLPTNRQAPMDGPIWEQPTPPDDEEVTEVGDRLSRPEPAQRGKWLLWDEWAKSQEDEAESARLEGLSRSIRQRPLAVT